MSEWISVKTKMPKPYTDVMIYDRLEGVVVGDYHKEYGMWYYNCWKGRTNIKDVTHWMPLPKRPKQGGQK